MELYQDRDGDVWAVVDGFAIAPEDVLLSLPTLTLNDIRVEWQTVIDLYGPMKFLLAVHRD